MLPKLSDALRSQLQQSKLSEKVNYLLELGSQAILGSSLSNNKNDHKSSASTLAASQGPNTTDEKCDNQAKRKRSFENSNNSSNDENCGTEVNTNKRHKASRLGHYSKKRRVVQPYCFLNSKALQRHKKRYNIKVCTSTTTDEDAIEESQSSIEDENTSDSEVFEEEEEEVVGDEDNEDCDDMFAGEKPTKESTPRNKSNRKVEKEILPVSFLFIAVKKIVI